MAFVKSTTLLIAGQALWVGGLFAAQPTIADARKFMDDAEQRLLVLSNEAQQASWVEENFITSDTESLAALENERATDEQVRLAKESKRFDAITLPPDLARKMRLLRIGFTLATPADPKESEEVSRLAAELDGMYGKGKYCPPALASCDKKCLDIGDITRIMATSSNPAELLDAWKGWHAISPPMRKDFTRFVELSNQGARELGFRDTGAMWRSKYDMPPDDFAKELDRLWAQVRPLYLSLHAYVRNRLREKYGDAVVPANGPIPADLLGNIWAQDWSNIYPLVAPPGADPGYDLTRILKDRKTQPLDMVRYGESFFKSLGFAPLPATFWERSLFVNRATGTWFAMPAPGTWTAWRICASRCASISRPRTSSPFTTSWATTSTSALTTSSHTCSATAPTTACMKPSATPSRSR